MSAFKPRIKNTARLGNPAVDYIIDHGLGPHFVQHLALNGGYATELQTEILLNKKFDPANDPQSHDLWLYLKTEIIKQGD